MENQEKLEQEEQIEQTEINQEEVEKEPKLTEEELQKQEQMQLEREAFDLEDGIEFQEIINEEDAIQFNFYLQSNSGAIFRKIFSSLIGLFIIGYVIHIEQYYGFIAIGALIVIYAIFLSTPIQKYRTRKIFKKRSFTDLVINMKFGENKIKYELDSETISPLVDYSVIQKVVKTEKYIYLHISLYQVIIVKIEGLECKEQLISFLKEKYEPLRKYKEK